MTPEEKKWIDEASLYALLKKWRHTPLSDHYFQNEERTHYFLARMSKFRLADNDAWVAASKAVGWDS